MIHLRLYEPIEDSYLVRTICGNANKDKTVNVVDLDDVNCPECRGQILILIEEWSK